MRASAFPLLCVTAFLLSEHQLVLKCSVGLPFIIFLLQAHGGVERVAHKLACQQAKANESEGRTTQTISFSLARKKSDVTRSGNKLHNKILELAAMHAADGRDVDMMK